jgi:hypothetical protein
MNEAFQALEMLVEERRVKPLKMPGTKLFTVVR